MSVEFDPTPGIHAPKLRTRRTAANQDRVIGAEQPAVLVVPQLAGMANVGRLPLQVRVTDGARFILGSVAKISGFLRVGCRRLTRREIRGDGADKGVLRRVGRPVEGRSIIGTCRPEGGQSKENGERRKAFHGNVNDGAPGARTPSKAAQKRAYPGRAGTGLVETSAARCQELAPT